MQQLGGSFGTAVLAVIGQRGLDGGAEPAFTRAFLWTTVFRVVAAGAGLRLPARVAAAERPS